MRGVFSWSVLTVLCVAMLGASCLQPSRRPRPVVRPYTPPPAPVPKPQPAPTTEIRAMWVSDTTRLDWNHATAKLQRAGFNTLFVNFASAGAAFYPSKVLPNVTGASTDSMAAGIALAHQRGIAVHAKLIVTFMFKAPQAFQNKLLAENRVMCGADRQPILQSGRAWLCPSNPANRGLLTATVSEILSRYRVDGVQLDYIRFNENPSCFCDHCRREFEQSIGRKLKRWPGDVLTGVETTRFIQWRIGVINAWVRDLAGTARSRRPGIPISAAVFPDLNRAREEKGQDWKGWLDRGQVNYVCPMNYTTDPRQFAEQNRQVQAVAGRNRVLVGIGSWKFEQMTPLFNQITSVRQGGAAGFALFSYDDAAARDFWPQVR